LANLSALPKLDALAAIHTSADSGVDLPALSITTSALIDLRARARLGYAATLKLGR
jgi:hypothetical protein